MDGDMGKSKLDSVDESLGTEIKIKVEGDSQADSVVSVDHVSVEAFDTVGSVGNAAEVHPEAEADSKSEDFKAEGSALATKPKSKPKMNLTKKQWIILGVVGAVVLIVLLALFYVFVIGKDDATAPAERSSQLQAPESEFMQITEDVSLDLTKVEFLGTAQSVGYMPVFSEDGLREYFFIEGDTSSIKGQFAFSKIGLVDGNDLVLVRVPPQEMGGDEPLIFVKTASGGTIVKKNSGLFSSQSGEYYGPKLATGFSVDSNAVINQLSVKDKISFNNVSASKTSQGFFFADTIKSEEITKVAEIPEGVVYEKVSVNSAHGGVKQFAILLQQPSGLFVPYRYTTEILNDDNSVSISFNDGKKTTEKYQWAMVKAGCGVVDSVNVIDKAYFNDLKEVGAASGEKVYQLKTVDHPAFKTIYDTYNYNGERQDAVSPQEFLDSHGMIVVRNKLGYRVVLVNEKFQSQGECGKPVIYLYPEKMTTMRVEVGADVTVSIPDYGTGWDVTAFPNGKLINRDGKVYPYLFWEGLGHGKYPDITEGFVIESSKAEVTLRAHLKALGLNEQESADFLEFWLPLMPDTRYTRLTWFGTQQMNELAPLRMSVQPDTMIRVFLDFEGLDRPINLKPQRLAHPERKGFVLVEWGGLRFVY